MSFATGNLNEDRSFVDLHGSLELTQLHDSADQHMQFSMLIASFYFLLSFHLNFKLQLSHQDMTAHA
jgi:hypothetical protein